MACRWERQLGLTSWLASQRLARSWTWLLSLAGGVAWACRKPRRSVGSKLFQGGRGSVLKRSALRFASPERSRWGPLLRSCAGQEAVRRPLGSGGRLRRPEAQQPRGAE